MPEAVGVGDHRTAGMPEARAELAAAERDSITPVRRQPFLARPIPVAVAAAAPTRGAMDPAPPAGAEW